LFPAVTALRKALAPKMGQWKPNVDALLQEDRRWPRKLRRCRARVGYEPLELLARDHCP